jgi:hypothetical protein
MPGSTKPSTFDTAEVNTDVGSGVIDTWPCTWPGEGAAWTAAGASAVTTAVSAVATAVSAVATAVSAVATAVSAVATIAAVHLGFRTHVRIIDVLDGVCAGYPAHWASCLADRTAPASSGCLTGGGEPAGPPVRLGSPPGGRVRVHAQPLVKFHH